VLPVIPGTYARISERELLRFIAPAFPRMAKSGDVVIVGAGAAGLTAAAELGNAGLSVTVLEARDRIGGRMFTVHDQKCDAPVELGAEFIHGRPPEIWNLLRKSEIKTHEVAGDSWCLRRNKLSRCNFFPDVDEILSKMSDRKPDQSFQEFLDDCCIALKKKGHANERLEEAKQWATGYVSGFNAADPAIVGVHWLVKETRADEKIGSDRSFRAQHGYADLIKIFQRKIDKAGVPVRKNTVVQTIRWGDGKVEIDAHGEDGTETFEAGLVLITIPLGVLQAREDEIGAIRFTPALPAQKRRAIHSLMMGKIIRVTLRFRERFWKSLPKSHDAQNKRMDKMDFLFSRDEWLPTWWTMAPEKLPFLTGWAPFRCAEKLSGKSQLFVIERSLQTLHRLLGMTVRELEKLLEHGYCHDWQNDPFSRGAYSYGKVGGTGAEEALARPIQNTLFFAGEATSLDGHNGTVHGAIASGKRAAAEIIEAARSRTSYANNSLKKRR
jgi:monoamine oxidase